MTKKYGDSWRFVPDYDALAIRLREEREACGFTREEVSEILEDIGSGAASQSIWNWEKAKKHITLEHLFVLACIYDVEVGYLLTGLNNYIPGKK